MNNLNLVRGVFLVFIALAFGLPSIRYDIGTFSNAGPGLFPLVVSCMLFAVGVVMIVQSQFGEKVAMHMKFKSISVILSSLVGMVLLSQFINMSVGIIFLVFWSSMAANAPYSIARNTKIAACLLLIALAFRFFLGLQLPLY